ncbi:MAG: LysR family transcriptional regulator [Pseudomonadota bacterium]
MDLKQLRYFVRVAELGSFAKASDVLDVAQPTLSRQVRALELDLQASLLHRNGRGVELTAMGARFLEQAYGVLHAADAAIQVLQGDDRRFTGHVACGMTPSVGRKLVAEYVRRFRTELPNATLTISNQLSLALGDQLRAARLDFIVAHDPIAPAAHDVTVLRRQHLYVVGKKAVGSVAETVAIGELRKVPLLLPSRAYAVRRAIELEAARAGVPLDIRSEVDVLDAIFELVAEGVGHTVATSSAVTGINHRTDLIVQRIVAPEIQIELALVTPADRSLTPLQRRAADLAKALFGCAELAAS